MRHAEIAAEFGVDNVILSVKSTDVRLMIEAYRSLPRRRIFHYILV